MRVLVRENGVAARQSDKEIERKSFTNSNAFSYNSRLAQA